MTTWDGLAGQTTHGGLPHVDGVSVYVPPTGAGTLNCYM